MSDVTSEEQQAEAAEQAAFDAAMAEAKGVEVQQTEAVEEPEQEQTEEQQPPVEEVEEQRREFIAGLTEEQVKDLLLKAQRVDHLERGLDKAFGKFGEVQKILNQRQLDVAGDDFAELKENFPEVADLIAKGIARAKARAGSSGEAFNPEVVQNLVNQKLEESARKYEEKLLDVQHSDWRDVVRTQDFGLWLGSLPEDEQQTIASSWDSRVVGNAVARFKASRQPVQQQQQKQSSRLASAIPATTGNKPAPAARAALSEDEAFAAEFARIRRR